MSESMIERVAIAIRRNKFERNGRVSVFDPSLITEEELGEARAAIEAMRPYVVFKNPKDEASE